MLSRVLAVALLVGGVTLACGEVPTLVPAPREVHWSGGPALPMPKGSVAIVLGGGASVPERQAARLLQEFVSKRFGQHWPVLCEGQEQPAHQTLVLLGQRTTCRRLDELCKKHAIDLSETAPGFDGYIIRIVEEGQRRWVLVGGCNARGVEYGQDTLSQMLQGSSSELALVPGTIRDAPSIPWRGRPQTSVRHYLRPGELDLYVTARANFIDLRGGIYAFEPGEKLDSAEISEAVKQAHLRGLVVYGTVNCGVARREYEKVLGTFRELLALGADGLWLSFDDKGPGEDPVTLTQQVLELGRAHQITGHLIAVTPPKGSYQQIVTDFNRKLLAVPGMEQATWFWTGVPSARALEEARSVGLQRKPGWWHNWPRDFTVHAYTGVPPLAAGWHAADYETLAVGGECLEAVMPWGGNAYGQHYIVPTILWWGWNPRGHDWTALRQRIYGMVFGPELARTALQFDDDLNQLFGLCRYSYKTSEELPFCPPRLRATGSRDAARQLAGHMTGLLDDLARRATNQSLLAPADVEKVYLAPMRKELETHRAAVELAYPEEWWPEHQRHILEALYAGDNTGVDKLLAQGRSRVMTEIEQVGKSLPAYPHLKAYQDWWRQRAGLDAKGWQALVEARRGALKERVRLYGRQVVSPANMLEGLRSPPFDWGIGRWQVSNRVLATIMPSPNEWFWGDWLAGLEEYKGQPVAVFASDRKAPGDLGEYGELKVTVPVTGQRGRLALLVYVSSANKDLFSNTLTKYRWAGYRFVELLSGEQRLWEADLGRVPESGEWFLVRLPALPPNLKELPLRLRVEDRKLSLNNYTLCYVGPIRLMEVPE